jgi:hypothetical protein
MSLFEDLYEEPTIDYIETLLVIVSKTFIQRPQDTFLLRKFY